MKTIVRVALLVLWASGVPALALAQRVPFDRTIDISEPTTLDVITGSGQIEVEPGAGFLLDAASRSGSVTLERTTLAGSATKHAAKGTVGTGGPVMRLQTGSGAIRVHGADRQICATSGTSETNTAQSRSRRPLDRSSSRSETP